jgi:hypothetical protein
MPGPTLSRVTVTPYPELDGLLADLLGHWRRILGSNLVGAYVQGSFALGAGDLHSDCDFLVATQGRLTDDQEAGLRALHAEVPHREGHWCHHLEGSFAPAPELASVGSLGRTWLFVDHGWDTMQWDDHCNRAYTRWILRERGLTLAGPVPATWMEEVPPTALRRESRTALPTLLADLATWVDIDAIAWGQRYAVVTACRLLFTIETAEVASKAGALEWAQRRLDPRWRPLLAQVRDDRALGFSLDQAPRPRSAAAARAFVRYAVTWAERQH